VKHRWQGTTEEPWATGCRAAGQAAGPCDSGGCDTRHGQQPWGSEVFYSPMVCTPGSDRKAGQQQQEASGQDAWQRRFMMQAWRQLRVLVPRLTPGKDTGGASTRRCRTRRQVLGCRLQGRPAMAAASAAVGSRGHGMGRPHRPRRQRRVSGVFRRGQRLSASPAAVCVSGTGSSGCSAKWHTRGDGSRAGDCCCELLLLLRMTTCSGSERQLLGPVQRRCCCRPQAASAAAGEWERCQDGSSSGRGPGGH